MNENKVPQEINNIVGDNVKALAKLFPSAVKDGLVDFEALKEELGTFEKVDAEKYELTWSGKQDAKKLSQEDIYNRTLKYIEKDSKNPNTTENLYIEGDNLEVLKLLRQNYYGAIKMIYIDPPYNTDGDFVYNDKFSMTKEESDKKEGTRDKGGNPLQKNQKSTNRYHANWLNMMYPRLKLARDLLLDDGVIVINIDEHEVVNMQKLCYEIFYEDNELGTIVWDKRNPKGDAKGISYQHESLLLFAKNKNIFLEKCSIQRPKKNAQIILNKASSQFKKISSSYSFEQANSEFSKWVNAQKDFTGGERAYNKFDENGEVYRAVSMAWPNKKQAPKDYCIPLIHPITKKACAMPDRGWRNPSSTMKLMMENNQILFGKDETTIPNSIYLLKNNMYENIPSILYYGGSDTSLLQELGIPFDTPKVVDVCKEHILSFTSKCDIVLDFFSGSSTTAHAVMQLNAEDGGNRKFIMVQYPEATDETSEAYKAGYKNICEIGKERIRRAGEQIIRNAQCVMPNSKPNADPNYELRTTNYELDTGFKVFRTSDTNIKWNTRDTISSTEIENNNPDFVDFTDNFNDLDVVYEIMLRQRDVALSEQIEILTNIGKRTYLYASTYLICLETEITNAMVEKLAALEPLPRKFVFRDTAFKDDINLKDETFRRLALLVERNTGDKKRSYTVEFI